MSHAAPCYVRASAVSASFMCYTSLKLTEFFDNMCKEFYMISLKPKTLRLRVLLHWTTKSSVVSFFCVFHRCGMTQFKFMQAEAYFSHCIIPCP